MKLITLDKFAANGLRLKLAAVPKDTPVTLKVADADVKEWGWPVELTYSAEQQQERE